MFINFALYNLSLKQLYVHSIQKSNVSELCSFEKNALNQLPITSALQFRVHVNGAKLQSYSDFYTFHCFLQYYCLNKYLFSISQYFGLLLPLRSL